MRASWGRRVSFLQGYDSQLIDRAPTDDQIKAAQVGLNMFDIPKLFQNGGPDNATLTTSLFIYNQAFSGSYMYNRAAAASMVMFVIIGILAAIMFYVMRDKDEAQLRKQIKQQQKEYRMRQKSGKENA